MGSDDEESSEKTFMYYVNDGVYGSFNCILYGHAHVKPLLQKRPKPDEKYYSPSIWGPTCDGLDASWSAAAYLRCTWGTGCSLKTWVLIPWLLLPTFNGFQRPTVYYVRSGPTWQLMQQIQNRDFPPEVEEDAGALPVSCAWESGMEPLPAACPREHVDAIPVAVTRV
ncbi:Ornithine decarboxylase [Myotis davidii]|uniref:ornithine decarboxylase n=1 Tax=Myotis davidii TaxID=225400 RepID=L5LV53_MYODS|nr:Ornithine decarboxylase [Myotis davidii]